MTNRLLQLSDPYGLGAVSNELERLSSQSGIRRAAPQAFDSDGLRSALADLLAPRPAQRSDSLSTLTGLTLGDLLTRPSMSAPAHLTPQTKRKAFFSFHYDDVMRVNNVRNAWKIDHYNSSFMRSFQDSSMWETKKRTQPELIKAVIREAMSGTSVVCVLVGSSTWSRRWVRYEIARAIVGRKGLLAVHINKLRHHKRGTADAVGCSPFSCMGILNAADGNYRLYELRPFLADSLSGGVVWNWVPYQDHRAAVPWPKFLGRPTVGYIQPLDTAIPAYDYVEHVGHSRIGGWMDLAAKAVGR